MSRNNLRSGNPANWDTEKRARSPFNRNSVYGSSGDNSRNSSFSSILSGYRSKKSSDKDLKDRGMENSDVWSMNSNLMTTARKPERPRSECIPRGGVHAAQLSRNQSDVSLSSVNSNVRSPNPYRQKGVLSEKPFRSLAKRIGMYFRGRDPNSGGSGHSHSHSSLFRTYSGTNHTSSSSSSSSVKETHYVHVEYDPMTRRRVLNTYEIIRDLGKGQHGKVKLARDLATSQLVAIKIVNKTTRPNGMGRLPGSNSVSNGETNELARHLLPKMASREEEVRREIAIMKKCSNKHIVKLIEVLDAECSRKIYMVLEYMEKGEIRWQRKDSSTDDKPEPLLDLNEVKRVFRDVVFGLEYLHHQGIVHRDIKPSNLLVDKNGVVKISDFGISFAAHLGGQLELAKTAGTPAFLAPELCNTDGIDDVKVTYKIDIWALGVTLYCLLFGNLPFHGETEFQLFEEINNATLLFPEMTDWKVAKPLRGRDFTLAKNIVYQLLKRDPVKRWEIDEIKDHPFFVDGMEGEQLEEYNQNWDNEMQIDVTPQDVDNAVTGIGSRIRNKIASVLNRSHKSSHHSSIMKSLTKGNGNDSSSNSRQFSPSSTRSQSFMSLTGSSNADSANKSYTMSEVHVPSPKSLTHPDRSSLVVSQDLSSSDSSLSDHSSITSTEAHPIYTSGRNGSNLGKPESSAFPPAGAQRRMSLSSASTSVSGSSVSTSSTGSGSDSAESNGIEIFPRKRDMDAVHSNLDKFHQPANLRGSTHFGVGLIPVRSMTSAISIPDALKPLDMEPVAPSLTDEFYQTMYQKNSSNLDGSLPGNSISEPLSAINTPISGFSPGDTSPQTITAMSQSSSFGKNAASRTNTKDNSELHTVAKQHSLKEPPINRPAIYGKKLPLTLISSGNESSVTSSASSTASSDSGDDELFLTVNPDRSRFNAARRNVMEREQEEKERSEEKSKEVLNEEPKKKSKGELEKDLKEKPKEEPKEELKKNSKQEIEEKSKEEFKEDSKGAMKEKPKENRTIFAESQPKSNGTLTYSKAPSIMGGDLLSSKTLK